MADTAERVPRLASENRLSYESKLVPPGSPFRILAVIEAP
jgi:hypothetical protein